MQWRQRVSVMPVAIAVSLVLVALLAVLQYRWAGELSEAERDRLLAAARASADSFARDFDAEVTRAYVQLALPPGALASRDFGAWSDRFEGWRRSFAYPELIQDVYLLERAGGETRLSVYTPASRTFEPAAWPEALAPLRSRFGTPGPPAPPEPGRPRRGPFDPIIEEIPALVAPVFDRPMERREGPGERREGPGEHRFGPALMVAVLDEATLRDRVLPASARRSFGGADAWGYDLVVVRPRDHAVIWRSRPEVQATARADATASLLDLRFDALAGDHPPPPFGGRRLFGAEDAGAWQLVVSRRAGPLELVVAEARRRNLAVSLGTLALLLASVSLVVAASQRAHRLAERQMLFVSAVSHELRTPVSVICATAENLADGVVTGPDQVRLYGAVVRDEGRRLGEMVEHILAFAGAGSGTLARQEVHLADVVESALAALQPTLSAHLFRVETAVDDDLPQVVGDARALQHAVQNLVENAVKYDRGERWAAVRASLSTDGRWVRLEVVDRGSGIAPSELRQVFDPFFRGRDALASQARGFGLGLALVRRIAEDHGGRVRAASVPGEGSTFTLELPIAPVRAAAGEPLHGPHPVR